MCVFSAYASMSVCVCVWVQVASKVQSVCRNVSVRSCFGCAIFVFFFRFGLKIKNAKLVIEKNVYRKLWRQLVYG